jgi:hypothetical protein
MDVTVKILKWEKFNPRKDIKRPHWFALDNELVEDDAFFKFDHGEFKAWIYLLSKASKKQNASVIVDFEAATRKARISKNEFIGAIEKLVEMQSVELIGSLPVRDPIAPVQNPNATLHYKTLQNRTEQDTTEQLSEGRKPKRTRAAKPPAPEGTSDLIKLFHVLWKQVYGTSPTLLGKDRGLLGNLVHDVGLPRASELVTAYLSSRESWFLTRRHDVPTLMSNLNNAALVADTGKSLTRTEINQIDKQQTNQNTLDAVRRGEI